MYKSIKIEGFRQFEEFEINDLGAINLFLGQNNTGKSSILEAFYTHASGLNFNNFNKKIICKKGYIPNNPLDAANQIRTLFYSTEAEPYRFVISTKTDESVCADKIKNNVVYEASHKLEVVFEPSAGMSSIFNSKGKGYFDASLLEEYQNAANNYIGSFEINEKSYAFNSVKINYKHPNFPIDNKYPQSYSAILQDIPDNRYPNSDITVFYYLKRYNILENFIMEMKEAFPVIKNIDYIPYPEGNKAPVLIITNDGKTLPLHAFGDGLIRWYHIFGNLITFRNGIQSIEKIDSTFDPKSQKLLTSLLLEYSKKYNNQIMLCSHNLEFVNSFLFALYKNKKFIKEGEDPVRIFTLTRDKNNKLKVRKDTGREAFERRFKYKREII
jgi:AAA15 family ATPase/GTPase